MERDEALLALLDARKTADAFLFVCNGLLTRSVSSLGDDDRIFFLHGGMGLTVPVAAGFARASGRPTIALEGDGNAIMGMAGALCPRLFEVQGFVHVVMDNGIYETTGGQRTPRVSFDLTAHASNCGYEHCASSTTPEDLELKVGDGLAGRLSTFIHVPVNQGLDMPPRPQLSVKSGTRRFIEAAAK